MVGDGDLGAGISIILNDQYTQTADRIKQSHTGLADTLTNAGQKAFMFNELRNGLEAFAQGLDRVMEPGVQFDAKMHELSAISGVTGDALDLIGQNALDLSVKFGGSAADNVESFKLLLSKIGPDIAESPEALRKMGDNVDTLAKSMGGDVIGAANALSTSLNIYAGDLTDPIAKSVEMTRQMNVMAAAAKEGSAEVPQISESVKVAGLAAKNAGLTFEELNATIQILGKGAIYGSEAGIALRNTLAVMSQGDYMPKQAREGLIAAGVDIAKIGDASIPVKDRLMELSKIQGDAALVGEVFGKENKNAFMVLMEGLPTLDNYVTKISGTNSATEQAAIIMDSWQEKMGRIKAQMEGFAISIFNSTKEFLPFISAGLNGLVMLAQLGPALSSISGAFAAVKAAALTSLAPFLPWIAAAAALVGIFLAAKYAVNSFQAAMAGGSYETGFWGVIQKIGGVISGIIQVFKSWDGQTWTMSESMRDALENMGILQFVLNAATWIVRIKEFLKGMIDGFLEVWAVAKSVWSAVSAAVSSAISPIIARMREWMGHINATSSSLGGWSNIGKYVAYVIVGLLVPGLIAAAAAALSFAISVIVALAPVIAIGIALYLAYEAVMWLWRAIVDLGTAISNAFSNAYTTVAGFVDYLFSVPALLIGMGGAIVENIKAGILAAWDGLKQMMISLIADLPMGESILSMVGAGGDVSAVGPGAAGALSLAGPKAGGNVSNIGNSVAAQRGAAATPAPPTIFDKSSTSVSNITLINQMDGEEVSKKVMDVSAMNDSRK